MKLVDTPGLRLWLKRRDEVAKVKNLEFGSDLYFDILKVGTDKSDLDFFLSSDRSRKLDVDQTPRDTIKKVDQLIKNGGILAGGAALRERLFPGTDGDFDVFYTDLPSFAKATIDTLEYPLIDVCLCEDDPVSSFDLTAPMAFRSSTKTVFSDESEKTIESGLCKIRFDWVFHPVATMGRVIKYGEKYGFRFERSQVASLGLRYGVSDQMMQEAFTFC